jgi:hypothetical protein
MNKNNLAFNDEQIKMMDEVIEPQYNSITRALSLINIAKDSFVNNNGAVNKNLDASDIDNFFEMLKEILEPSFDYLVEARCNSSYIVSEYIERLENGKI